MSQPPTFPLVPDYLTSVPTRMGTQLAVEHGRLVATLRPHPTIDVLGSVRASALVCLVDMIAGLEIDDDPTHWVFTSDLSVRVPAVAAPEVITATANVLRRGKRSSTIGVDIRDGIGTDAPELAIGLASFTRVPVRDGDPVKPIVDKKMMAAGWSQIPPLDVPVREAAGVTVVDAAAGVVSMEITRNVVNPSGALHGAMVALLAECATDELVASAGVDPAIVTDLDIRFLKQGRSGPMSTRARFVGPAAAGSVFVEIVDAGGAITSVVTARAQPIG